MKSKNVLKYLMVVAIIGLLFTGCKKKEDNLDNDTSAASDNALAEGTYNDAHNIADQSTSGSLTSYIGTYTSNERGVMVTYPVISGVDTIANGSGSDTINFGPTDHLCLDGRLRRGEIIVTYTGHYRSPGTVITITFSNYFVNDNQVRGTHTVTNMGYVSGYLTFNIQVNGTIIKANNGGTITWTSTRTRQWILGESTPQWNDDVYLITGSAQGTNAHGTSFTANITNALRREISCRHFVSGTFTLTPSGKATRTVDFGSGTCDDIATVTINGNVYTITLP